ncbi:Metal binding domain of Ada [uncultured archaeon]|nr:Metal binding domain of Ada [uncultured archaeon]
MRSTYILILLALLTPLALSAPASDTHSGGATIEVLSPISQQAPNNVTNASEYVFVGSIKSDKYHYPSCRAAQKIKPENEIWFTSSADAQAHGYVPCGICNPP